jgi:hypothetical protein
MCQINGATRVVQHYYNPENDQNPAPVLFTNPTVGFSNSQVSINNGLMTCSFRRQMSMPGTVNYLDISATPYNILLASGQNDASSKLLI